MIVMKFGGTSVQDAQAIDRVAAIVRERLPERPVVVVSALAKITDQLLAMAAAAGAGSLAGLSAFAHANIFVGRSGRRSRTMAATRSMAWASCTEVPPNFMTIMRAPGGKSVGTAEARRRGEEQDLRCVL